MAECVWCNEQLAEHRQLDPLWVSDIFTRRDLGSANVCLFT